MQCVSKIGLFENFGFLTRQTCHTQVPGAGRPAQLISADQKIKIRKCSSMYLHGFAGFGHQSNMYLWLVLISWVYN